MRITGFLLSSRSLALPLAGSLVACSTASSPGQGGTGLDGGGADATFSSSLASCIGGVVSGPPPAACQPFVQCVENHCSSNLTTCFGPGYATGTITGDCAGFESCATANQCTAAAGVSCAESTTSTCKLCVAGLVSCADTSCASQFAACVNGVLSGLRGDGGVPEGGPRDGGSTDGAGGDAGTCTPASTPVITEFAVNSTLASGPVGIVLGPDGNLWFALNAAYGTTNEGSGAAIGRMSPDGSTSTAFALPSASSGPWSVTAGPDGKIWFTESSAGKVGHIDVDGTNATEITLPASNARPNGITAGPDGNLWFTEQGAGNIGWVSPSTGAVTEIPIPTSGSSPTGITAGPDGRIWFVEAQGDKVGAIATTAGATITEYPMGTHMGSQFISVGPDGNLWFTSFAGKGLGQCTTSGAVQIFPTGVSTWQVVPGADGNLWFAENESNAIGQMTPTGTVTSFPIPTASSNVNGMATGPGGTVWFTEQGSGKVGRVTICK